MLLSGSRLTLLLCAIAAALNASPAAADDETPNQTAPQIASAIRRALQQVKSIYISYTIATKVHSDIAPNMTKGRGSYNEAEEFGLQGEKIFRRRMYWEVDQKGERARWNELRLVFDGSRTGEQRIMTVAPNPPDAQPASIVPCRIEGKFFGQNPYLNAIGAFWYDGRWLAPWVIEAVAEPSAPFSLPEALSDVYRVLPAFETVGDSRCVVLVRDGRDRLWLDNDCGFAVVRREWKWSESDALMFRFAASKLVERAPGLWLPDRVAAELWVKPVAGRWDENIHLKTSTCDVAKLAINDVPADLFEISFPRGTGVVDASVLERKEGGHPVLQYTAGVTAEETQANLDASLRQQQESERGNTLRSTSIWICSALLLAGVAAVLFFVRSRRRSP